MRKHKWALMLLVVGSMGASMLWRSRTTPMQRHSVMTPTVASPMARDAIELPEPDQSISAVILTLPAPVTANTKADDKPEADNQKSRVHREFGQPNDQCPDGPQRTRMDEAYAKLRKDMTETETIAALKACDVAWDPVIADTCSYFGKTTRRSTWECKRGIDDGNGAVTWAMKIEIYFADGKLYGADRIDERTMTTRWDSLWSPIDTAEK